MSTSTAPSVRCPRCSAHLRAGSDWCSLCYADLRPAPAGPPPAPPAAVPETSAEVPDEPAAESPAAADADVEAPAPVRPRGKHARRESPSAEKPTNPDDVEALAQQLLAELAVHEQKNPLGPLAGLVDTTQKKVGLMVGGAVAAMCLLFLLMAVLGALL